jgi:epoxyqueuosine reductase
VTSHERQEELRRRIAALGFDQVRFAALRPVPGDGLRGWLESGYQADMVWMERTAAKRLQPDLVLPGARAVIMLGVAYSGDTWPAPGKEDSTPIWARYSVNGDYHDTLKPGLAAAGKILEELYGLSGADYRYYVDTGPVLEREWAGRSGLGFIGKNAMLISRRHGNWLFLSALFTRVDLIPDPPISKGLSRKSAAAPEAIGLLCGKCTRCLDACPTGAFAAPGVVDSRLCISDQTIENRGIIPRALRPGIGTRVFGCDICLEVCPWNRFARTGRRLLLTSRDAILDLTWRDLLALTPGRFAACFRHTSVHRLKLNGLLRNACVGAGNSGDAGLLPPLSTLAAQAAPLVRVHAVWAVYRLAGRERAAEMLRGARSRETDGGVLEEYEAWDGAG